MYQMVEHQFQLTELVRFSSSNPMRHICYRINIYTSVCIIMIYHALHHASYTVSLFTLNIPFSLVQLGFPTSASVFAHSFAHLPVPSTARPARPVQVGPVVPPWQQVVPVAELSSLDLPKVGCYIPPQK